METFAIKQKLAEKNLKITPQRLAILEAVVVLKNHPTAENIVEFIRKSHPNIATATVYKVLEILVENGLIHKVKTDKDCMRYDAITEKHHHLYSLKTDRIEDYVDDELTQMIEAYFLKKGIENFQIEDVKLQIIGKFTV